MRDEPDALRAAFSEAAASADAVITSGGVSVGEADHTKQIMAELGDVLFWRIAMRPGRPMAIGASRIRRRGDPVRPARQPGRRDGDLLRVRARRAARDERRHAEPLPLLRAASTTPLRKKPGRTEYQRGIVSRGADGRWQVAITGGQGSGILSSMSAANGMVVLHHAQGNVAAGDEVDVIPFDGLV